MALTSCVQKVFEAFFREEQKVFRSVSEKARSLMKENVSGQSECENCVCACVHVCVDAQERDDSGESKYVSM